MGAIVQSQPGGDDGKYINIRSLTPSYFLLVCWQASNHDVSSDDCALPPNQTTADVRNSSIGRVVA